MKKQDMNGVRVAQDLERKYRLQDIETAEAQAKAAVSGLQSKLDLSEYEEDTQALQEQLEQLQETLEQMVEDAKTEIEEATEEAIQSIENQLSNYVLISSELSEEDIEEILEGE